MAAGGAAAISLLPPSLRSAMARPMPTGGLDAVEHVVVLMQENRSFDHYYGRLAGVRGFGDRTPLRIRSGRSVFEQPDADAGFVLPYSVREAAAAEGRDPEDIQYLNGLPHSYPDATQAWADGWYDDWSAAKGVASMTYYDRPDIPLQFELADNFTICDAYFCSVFGSTNPNRNYLFSGTTGYEPGTNQRAISNAAYSYDHAGYEWTTYPERLESAGVSWQIYQEWDNFTDNAVEYFRPFKRIGTKIVTAADLDYRTTEEFYYAVLDASDNQREKLLAAFDNGLDVLTPAERRLFDRAMRRREQPIIEQVRADIEAGTLPQVSWLVPNAADSEHPSTGTPVGSANLIYDLLDAIASDPDTWSKTVLLINFDENDGYFDHVPPPIAPRPTSGNGDDWYNGKPIGLGPRVPMTIVSPWTIGGHVNSEVADHSSVLRFLEAWTGVQEPNISAWRRQVCGDLLSAFDFDLPGEPAPVRAPDPVPDPITRWLPDPPAEQRLPAQEPGRRPARALPYHPVVSAALDGSALELRLGSTGTASHFTIYSYETELPFPTHVDAKDTDVERLTLPGSSYHLAIQGPNRFWYQLRGTTEGAGAGVVVRSPIAVDRGGSAIELTNTGDQPVTVRLRSLHYADHSETVRLQADQRRSVTWPTEQGWYDVRVTVDGDEHFQRGLTGRIENGQPGITG